MKSFVSLFVSALIVGLADQAASAQPSYGAAAYAQREQEEQRWKKLSAQMEEMLASQEAMRRRIQSLEEENRRLTKKLNESGSSAVSPAQLNNVVKEMEDRIRKVDDARVTDHQKLTKSVNDSIDKLESLLKNQPRPAASGSASTSSGTFYTHTIQSGQTISAVAAAFRKQGVKVYDADIIAANPGIDPTKLQVGQQIKIPKP